MSVGTAADCAPRLPVGAAPPVHPDKAPEARTVGLPSDRAARTGPLTILGERGDEIGMHRHFLPLGAISASQAEILLSCIAGCFGVSGRGYYAAGPDLDVPDVPLRCSRPAATGL